MTTAQQGSPRASAKTDFDAIIIGAGFSGMYMLHSLRDKLDMNVTVFEAGDGVGGTWYWNRYPGARCDSDSYVYCYTFDKNLLQEWSWSERYPEQDEILRYLEHCAERFNSASASSRSPSTKAPGFGRFAPTKATSPKRVS
jgi:cation diffusion facilitator CzcD-associated flavoprotein CzcO